MKKYYALVYIPVPEQSDTTQLRAYGNLIDSDLSKLKMPNAEKQTIAENCWLLDRESDVQILAKIVSSASKFGLEAKVRYLSEEC